MSPRWHHFIEQRWLSSASIDRPSAAVVARVPAACALTLLMAACGGGGERPLQVPEAPPETLEVLVSPSTPEQGADEDSETARVSYPLTKQAVRRDGCGIPVAVNPIALMRPGVIEQLQRRLVERELLKEATFERGELDGPTLTALAQAQRELDLPVVEMPNYATLRELGLEPTEAFISGDATCEGAD